MWKCDEELRVGHSIQYVSRNNTFHHIYAQPLVDILDSKGVGIIRGQRRFDAVLNAGSPAIL